MFEVVLVEPQIPPNTGNVIRLCANTGARLHLVGPMGFPLDSARMRRAGLDYHEFARMHVHGSWREWWDRCQPDPGRISAFSAHARQGFAGRELRAGDWLVFGSETTGLPADLLERLGEQSLCRLPMRPGNRSLNLSNAVAVAVFEGWRQLGYEGGT